MTKQILFPFPGNEPLAELMEKQGNVERGRFELRHFPDGESYIRVDSPVSDAEVLVLCTLDRPDLKLLPLVFTTDALKQLGAARVTLVAPYLAYMRQDRRFHPGEAITSASFASLISAHMDALVTIDPHLHRRSNLGEIYSIPTRVGHAASAISSWIRSHVPHPLVIGPDEESRQWVSEVARDADAPFLVLRKTRLGDREVQVSLEDHESHEGRTPVLVDDIISTARTMIEAVKWIRAHGLKDPVCVGVHAVFAEEAYESLKRAGPAQVVTCNTIPHPSNAIDITRLLLES